MKSRNKIKGLLIVLLILTTCSLTACSYDLGDYKDLDEYYDAFGDIYLYSKESKLESFTMEDFYNKETAGGSDGAKITTEIEEKTYMYLLFKVKEDAVVDDIALYFYSSSSEEDSLYWDIYHVRSDANIIDILKPRPYNYEEKEDDEEEEESEEEQEDYNDVETIEGAAQVNSSIIRVSNKWTSLMVSSWITSNDKNSKIDIKAGDYFVFRFKNNCFAGRMLSLNEVSFTATNLLIRALKED